MARKITAILALALLVGLATAVPPKGLRLPWATAKKVSAGAATGTVTSIGEGVMMDFSANPITTTGTIAFDTAAFKLWWTSSAGAWDTFKIMNGWGLLKSSSGDTVTLTGDSATIGTWGDARWLVVAYSDTIQLARDTANAALARRDTLTAGWGIDLASQPAGDDTVAIDSATVHTWGDGFWLGIATGDTNAFHHNSLADTAETLNARAVNIDTTAGPGALNVAGSAWVRDTVRADWFNSPSAGGNNFYGGNTASIDSTPAVGLDVLLGTGEAWINGDGNNGIYNSTFSHIVGAATANNVIMSGESTDISGNAQHAFAFGPGAHIVGGSGVLFKLDGDSGTHETLSTTGEFLVVGNVRADTFRGDGSLLTGIGPVGEIIDWYGDSSAFPTGYVLCDGTRKFKNAAGDSVVTPDLRNFFTIGASIDTGNGIPMSTIEDTTGAVAKATGGSVKYTPAGGVDGAELANVAVDGEARSYNQESGLNFTGTRAVLVQPYVAVWKLIRSKTW